ncbi:protein TIC 55, chloroplastic isoform X2 [Telopea speciosissima]|uniref:protein TIC 55, chloroplastic isoform X2 n=1 Tax=Telopea speciosissima TaxID=54955 RepID=UPI001CC62C30|nr:protein TIC 55, chloroplastic isoform X2 [Telopea speciosissima]
MALIQPFYSDISLGKPLPLSVLSHNPTNPGGRRRRTETVTFPVKGKLNHMRTGLIKCSAVAEVGEGLSEEEVFLGYTDEEDEKDAGVVADYDWREEWYPLYLSNDVPDDSPLGLTVFHIQIVLYRDGNGVLHCYEDRCPHRLAKLSEGQLIDGRLECLYHGWQFEGDGQCVKIPQLPAGARIPRSACAKTYKVRESQGVVWVWMSDKSTEKPEKLPWFEHYARPGFQDLSTVHELPYDHSILLENLMDPAHIPISHDRTDWTAKREDAQPLLFTVTERTGRGFAGQWGKEKEQAMLNFLRFEAPCVLQNNREFVDKDGVKQYFSALFLCRPAGQGKSMVIARFGTTKRSSLLAQLLPKWYFHQNGSKIFEQDMGFLSSQNEVLMKEKLPTKELYLNLKSSDTWVAEYRKWMDKVGHGMPYHFGHSTISLPKEPAVVENAPAGLVAGISASLPAKGGAGTMHAPNPVNRYFRHVIHCKGCRNMVQAFQAWKNALSIVTLASVALAILVSGRRWKVLYLVSTTFFLAGVYVCSAAITMNTENFIRKHRLL